MRYIWPPCEYHLEGLQLTCPPTILHPRSLHPENQRLGGRTYSQESPLGWQNIFYGRIYVDFFFLTVHKVCTKARLLGERSVRIREVKGSNPSRSTILCKSELNLLREALFRVCFCFRGCGSVRILFFRCIRYSLARLYLSDVFFLTGSIDICCANGYN